VNVKTTKKMKVIGMQQWTNNDTGEIEEFQTIQFTDRDFNFHKIWFSSVINKLENITSKKMKVAFYILENMKDDNTFVGRIKDIAKFSKTSEKTVTETLRILKKADLIRLEIPSVYKVNPDIIFKGGMKKRLNILQQYVNKN
jgi:hypothetical protein